MRPSPRGIGIDRHGHKEASELEPSEERLRVVKDYANDLRGEFEDRLAKLLETVRRLPPGPERHEFLGEIGRFQMMIDAIIAKQQSRQ